jgi:hypothetical protein
MREILKYIFWFVAAILSQVLVFDNMVFPGGFVLSVYIFFILILPFNSNRIVLMLVATILGIGIDALNDTFGLYLSSAVFLAWMRPYVYKWFEPVIGYNENQSPNVNDMGWGWTLKTYMILILLYHSWFYSLSFLRLIGPWFTVQKILLSSISTLLIIFVLQVLYSRKVNKNEF